MIAFIKGLVFGWDQEGLIIDVGGIGYRVLVPVSGFKKEIQVGEEIFLYTYLQVREDSWQLFGFLEKEQLEIFRLLIGVNGVGAKLGLAVLNHLAPARVVQAVVNGENNILSSVPGIGKKIAQRMVLELKEKFKNLTLVEHIDETGDASGGGDSHDAVLVLMQLGYSGPEARSAFLKAARILGPDSETQQLVKESLKILGKY